MDLKVIARVRDISEDELLQDIEPKELSFVWRKKYISPSNVDDYWELEKGKKTVVNYVDGRLDIIRENIDSFAKRLEAERAKCVEEENYPIESDVEFCEEEQEDTEEDE